MNNTNKDKCSNPECHCHCEENEIENFSNKTEDNHKINWWGVSLIVLIWWLIVWYVLMGKVY